MCMCVCVCVCVCVRVHMCMKTPRISSCDPSVVCVREFVGISTLRDELASLVEACCSLRGYYPELVGEAKLAPPLADVAEG